MTSINEKTKCKLKIFIMRERQQKQLQGMLFYLILCFCFYTYFTPEQKIKRKLQFAETRREVEEKTYHVQREIYELRNEKRILIQKFKRVLYEEVGIIKKIYRENELVSD